MRSRASVTLLVAAVVAVPAFAVAGSRSAPPGRAPVPPPVIGDMPADPTNATTARFTFSASRGLRFDCRLDDGATLPCRSPVAYANLAEGDHRFSVTATRGPHRLGATTVYRWEIDTTAPPRPTFTARPSELTARRDAAFSFTSAEPDVDFACALDDAPPAACASPYRLAPADGTHSFTVLTRDRAGNGGPPAVLTWSVDATAPPAPVLEQAPEETTTATSARFAFSPPPAGARQSCQLDGGAAQPCSSPVDYADLDAGPHSFTVTARDAAGNRSVVSHEWTVAVHPDATTGPVLETGQVSATVQGTVVPRGPGAEYFFEYGRDLSYGDRTTAARATGEKTVQATLTGLAPATEYHYRFVATTCGGCPQGTRHGADRTLTTERVRTYQNPVFGGRPDPMGARPSADYYVYATGDFFPIARSNDLVHWTPAGTALTHRPAWVPQTGQWNPWAPSVIERDGPCPGTSSTSCWVMFYTGLNETLEPDVNCLGVAVATGPEGPFTDTGILDTQPASTDSADRPIGCGDEIGHSNIDPAPFVDPSTGRAYLYLSTGRNADHDWQRTLSVIPLSGDLLHAAGARQPLFTMTEPWERDVVEGPWMVHRDARYYLLYSGAGFADASYAMGYAVALSPTGPFVKPDGNPILSSTADVIGPGGGSVVVGPHGGDWLIYHGRAVLGGARTLRIDPLVWADALDPPGLTIRGPTTSPQPVP